MDAFGRVAAVILAAVLVFLLPIQYVAVNRNASLRMQVHNETVKFADEIMMQGYLTKEMYNTYVYELDRSGELYDIEIIHGKPTEGYKTGSNRNSERHTNIVHSENQLFEKRVQKLEYMKTSRMNSKSKNLTNLSTINSLVQNKKANRNIICNTNETKRSQEIPVNLTVTPSSRTVLNGSEPTYTVKVNYIDNTSKIITDGYTKTGFTLGAGTKTVTFTYMENDKTVSASIEIIVMRSTKKCINGHTYELDDYDNDSGCPVCGTILKNISAAPEYITLVKGSELPITVTATYMDEHTEMITEGWSSNFDNNQLGNQLVTVTYKEKTTYVSVTVTKSLKCPICGNEYAPNPDGSDPGCMVCSKQVISITAAPAKQAVTIGEELKLEVEAIYKDGHHEDIDDWNSNFNPFKVGEQKVQVFYESVSTTITVIVESDTQTTCTICGTVYNAVINPLGCPVCSHTLIAINARLRNGGIQVQCGSELSLAIVLIYKDGHRIITYNGWTVEGYQSDVLGTQILNVSCQGLHTTLAVEVVNTLSKMICPNGHVYFLNEDGSDLGCPYCSDVENSNYSQHYRSCAYTHTILNEVYANGIYYFDKGDYITISVTLKSTSYLQKLQYMFNPITLVPAKYSYGGQVHG